MLQQLVQRQRQDAQIDDLKARLAALELAVSPQPPE